MMRPWGDKQVIHGSDSSSRTGVRQVRPLNPLCPGHVGSPVKTLPPQSLFFQALQTLASGLALMSGHVPLSLDSGFGVQPYVWDAL